MRSRLLKTTLIVVSVVLALWLASELAAPRIAASYVKREIRKGYPGATELSVSVRAFPAIMLAFKRYTRLTVEAGGVTLQGVDFDRIALNSPGWPGATFEAVIGPGEISRFFSLASSYLVDPEVSLGDNGLEVKGLVKTGDSTVDIEAKGSLRALNGRFVYFAPDEITASGVRVTPEGLATVRQVMDRSPIFTVREDLPYSITDMSVESGRLKISGNVNLEKALNFKL